MSSAEEVALKQFDTMSRYYAFETTMYWARSHFFLVANVGLLAFAASRLLEPSVDHPYLLIVVCAFGCILSIFWLMVLRAGQYWTDRWEAVCVKLEPAAMGPVEVFRNCRPGQHVSTKKVARLAAGLFIVTWIAAAGWVLLSTYKPQGTQAVPAPTVQSKPPQSN
jgi:hypothetical protein